jgi:hypothetical protein
MTTNQYTQIIEAVLNSADNLIDGFGTSVYNEYFYWLTINAGNIDLEYYITKYGADYKALAEDLMGYFLLAQQDEDYTLQDYFHFMEN